MKRCEYKFCNRPMPIENRKGSIQRWENSKYCCSKHAAKANTLKQKEIKEAIPVIAAAYKSFCL